MARQHKAEVMIAGEQLRCGLWQIEGLSLDSYKVYNVKFKIFGWFKLKLILTSLQGWSFMMESWSRTDGTTCAPIQTAL